MDSAVLFSNWEIDMSHANLTDALYDELRTALTVVSVQLRDFPAWPGHMTDEQEQQYDALLAEHDLYGRILRAHAQPTMDRVLGDLAQAGAA